MRDVDRYPHVLDGDVWHRRPDTDRSDGPVYPTRCGLKIRTFCVDDPEGTPESWQTRCPACYASNNVTEKNGA